MEPDSAVSSEYVGLPDEPAHGKQWDASAQGIMPWRWESAEDAAHAPWIPQQDQADRPKIISYLPFLP